MVLKHLKARGGVQESFAHVVCLSGTTRPWDSSSYLPSREEARRCWASWGYLGLLIALHLGTIDAKAWPHSRLASGAPSACFGGTGSYDPQPGCVWAMPFQLGVKFDGTCAASDFDDMTHAARNARFAGTDWLYYQGRLTACFAVTCFVFDGDSTSWWVRIPTHLGSRTLTRSVCSIFPKRAP